MIAPEKIYQLWTYSDGGYHFEEFENKAEIAARLQSGTVYGEWFITRLQTFRANVYNYNPPQKDAQ